MLTDTVAYKKEKKMEGKQKNKRKIRLKKKKVIRDMRICVLIISYSYMGYHDW